jgi:hypothetical protein
MRLPLQPQQAAHHCPQCQARLSLRFPFFKGGFFGFFFLCSLNNGLSFTALKWSNGLSLTLSRKWTISHILSIMDYLSHSLNNGLSLTFS